MIIVKYNHQNDMHAVFLRFSTLIYFKRHVSIKMIPSSPVPRNKCGY